MFKNIIGLVSFTSLLTSAKVGWRTDKNDYTSGIEVFLK